MRREAGRLLFQARCGSCAELFDIDRKATHWVCPYCSVMNRNPLRPIPREDDEGVEPMYMPQAETFGIPPYPRGEETINKRGLVHVFMVPSAMVSMFVGSLLLAMVPDDAEMALGLTYLFVGVLAIGASLVLWLRKDSLMAVVASVLMILVGMISVNIVDVFGLFVALFAAPGLIFALMLLKERELDRDEPTFVG
jgi:hypothetical protein